MLVWGQERGREGQERGRDVQMGWWVARGRERREMRERRRIRSQMAMNVLWARG
jgi:hypothetical protein